MAQTFLPLFSSGETQINELVSFEKRDGTVYYFHGGLPVFSHAEQDLASFRMITSQLAINGSCTQAQMVRAFGICANSMKRLCEAPPRTGCVGLLRIDQTLAETACFD